MRQAEPRAIANRPVKYVRALSSCIIHVVALLHAATHAVEADSEMDPKFSDGTDAVQCCHQGNAKISFA